MVSFTIHFAESLDGNLQLQLLTMCLFSPQALLVHLKRFDNNNQKNTARVHLMDTLSLPGYDNNYHLCGALNHIGDSVQSGHCTAMVKRDEQWVSYDDEVGMRRSIAHFTRNKSKQRQCYMAMYHI